MNKLINPKFGLFSKSKLKQKKDLKTIEIKPSIIQNVMFEIQKKKIIDGKKKRKIIDRLIKNKKRNKKLKFSELKVGDKIGFILKTDNIYYEGQILAKFYDDKSFNIKFWKKFETLNYTFNELCSVIILK